jgi:hypothetical protein
MLVSVTVQTGDSDRRIDTFPTPGRAGASTTHELCLTASSHRQSLRKMILMTTA